MKPVVHYAIGHRSELERPHVQLALERHVARAEAVVLHGPGLPPLPVAGKNPLAELPLPRRGRPATPLRLLFQALRHHAHRMPDRPFLFTGAHALGPIGASGQERHPRDGLHCLALEKRDGLSLPSLEYLWLSPAFFADRHCRERIDRLLDPQGGSLSDERAARTLAELVAAYGGPVHSILSPEESGPLAPLFQADLLIEKGAPAVSSRLFEIDPLVHDLHGADTARVLSLLHLRDAPLERALRQTHLRNMRLRDYSLLAGRYEVILPRTEPPPAMRVAVLVHLYYPDALLELWPAISAVPGAPHLFITTDTDKKAASIRAQLEALSWPSQRCVIRLVEENRGRDMAALFISLREEMLGGRFDVALRLHSKKTPQVPPRVALGFREHLLQNLAASRGHVNAILARFAEDPALGIVIPPVIHRGFATLGHAWFGNETGARRLRRDMGLVPPLDAATPVAPYGTMFWFRPAALEPLFRWRWRWRHYNPEPHHVDGGLAHVQERMICLVAQDRGYETLMVMTPENAARDYAALEHKLQALAAHMPDGNILHQLAWLEGRRPHQRLHDALARLYLRLGRASPSLGRALLPAARCVSRWLRGREALPP